MPVWAAGTQHTADLGARAILHWDPVWGMLVATQCPVGQEAAIVLDAYYSYVLMHTTMATCETADIHKMLAN